MTLRYSALKNSKRVFGGVRMLGGKKKKDMPRGGRLADVRLLSCLSGGK